jgi:hypothetical protein
MLSRCRTKRAVYVDGETGWTVLHERPPAGGCDIGRAWRGRSFVLSPYSGYRCAL